MFLEIDIMTQLICKRNSVGYSLHSQSHGSLKTVLAESVEITYRE